jgi:hypothetical protein
MLAHAGTPGDEKQVWGGDAGCRMPDAGGHRLGILSNSGVRNTPPPIPVSPARKPNPAPASSAMDQSGGRVGASAASRLPQPRSHPAAPSAAPSTSAYPRPSKCSRLPSQAQGMDAEASGQKMCASKNPAR